jgi:hypothetical protein
MGSVSRPAGADPTPCLDSRAGIVYLIVNLAGADSPAGTLSPLTLLIK